MAEACLRVYICDRSGDSVEVGAGEATGDAEMQDGTLVWLRYPCGVK
jgi:hypothetical protein